MKFEKQNVNDTDLKVYISDNFFKPKFTGWTTVFCSIDSI